MSVHTCEMSSKYHDHHYMRIFIVSGLHPTAASVSSLSIKGGDSDTASLRSDAISLNSYQSDHTYPTTCKVLYSYQVRV